MNQVFVWLAAFGFVGLTLGGLEVFLWRRTSRDQARQIFTNLDPYSRGHAKYNYYTRKIWFYGGIVAFPIGVVGIALHPHSSDPIRTMWAQISRDLHHDAHCTGTPGCSPAPRTPTATPTPTPTRATKVPLYFLIALATPHGRPQVDGDPWTCDDEAATDVPGGRVPPGCSAVAYVGFTPGTDLDGMVKVFRFRTPAAVQAERILQLRYMRQYDGLRQDVAVPHLANSRIIWTGADGDLLEVVFSRGSDLVMVWVSRETSTALTPAQRRTAVDLARRVDRVIANTT